MPEPKQVLGRFTMSGTDEVTHLIREATRQVEDELAIEDSGWINFSQSGEVMEDSLRRDYITLSRTYALKDPLAKQSIRLWTDYTFGTGMTRSVSDEDKKAKEVLESFWNSRDNSPIFSARGQRRCCEKGLVDGEVFFAIFLGPESTIRTINPLEITEIITDPDDRENVRYYRRVWTDTAMQSHDTYYRSIYNIKNEAVGSIKSTEDAVIYQIAFNNTWGMHGYPLLLPAIEWIRQYRRFLASRVAIMLALARFAWKKKVSGGPAAVATASAKFADKEIPAGSVDIENLGADLLPIKTDSNARNAYEDGRMLKLQVAAAVGIPEQYYGDISIGNLATAKTVELPMMKMFQSHQQVWGDAYQDIDEVVLEYNHLPTDTPIDRDWPPIAPEDVAQAAASIVQILTAMPDLAEVRDVKQMALMVMGLNNTGEILDQLEKAAESINEVKLTKAVRQIREVAAKLRKE